MSMKLTILRFATVSFASVVCAQSINRNISDGLTPPAIAPGAPMGVEAISNLERINLYNGQLSVSIPLLTVGGRGEAGYTIEAPVGTAPWTITMDSYNVCGTGQNCGAFSYGHGLGATNKELYPYRAPYSPGVV